MRETEGYDPEMLTVEILIIGGLGFAHVAAGKVGAAAPYLVVTALFLALFEEKYGDRIGVDDA